MASWGDWRGIRTARRLADGESPADALKDYAADYGSVPGGGDVVVDFAVFEDGATEPVDTGDWQFEPKR